MATVSGQILRKVWRFDHEKWAWSAAKTVYLQTWWFAGKSTIEFGDFPSCKPWFPSQPCLANWLGMEKNMILGGCATITSFCVSQVATHTSPCKFEGGSTIPLQLAFKGLKTATRLPSGTLVYDNGKSPTFIDSVPMSFIAIIEFGSFRTGYVWEGQGSGVRAFHIPKWLIWGLVKAYYCWIFGGNKHP